MPAGCKTRKTGMRRERNTEQMERELHGTVRAEGQPIHPVGLLTRAFCLPCYRKEGMQDAVLSKMTVTGTT